MLHQIYEKDLPKRIPQLMQQHERLELLDNNWPSSAKYFSEIKVLYFLQSFLFVPYGVTLALILTLN